MSPSPERNLHLFVAQLLRLSAVPGLIFYHPVNEGTRSPRTGAFLKRMGLLAGVADFAIVLPGGRACFLELKAPKKYPDANQREFRLLCEKNGTPYQVARTTEEAIGVLVEWGAIRRTVPRAAA